jgi:hypothetical protein
LSLSAAFTVNSSSAIQNHSSSYGATVTLAVSSMAFHTIEWTIMSVSHASMVAPTITYGGTPSGATATFAMPSDPGDGEGRTVLVKCLVTDQRGRSASATRKVGVANDRGYYPLCPDETNETSLTMGWTPQVNSLLAGISTMPAISDPADDNKTVILANGTYNKVSAQFNVKSPAFGTATGDGVTSDQTAVADAAGAELYWPPGTYLTTATIANLHSVKHRGPGVIKRGSDLFPAEPGADDENTLYVSTAGTGDGLSSSQPMSEAALFAALPNYGPVLNGQWACWFAAGTYNSTGNTVEGLRSLNRIEFYGPSVGASPAVPTAIFDGSGAGSDACGMYFRDGMNVYIKDVKFQDFDPSGNGCGVAADELSKLYVENVHTTTCANGIDVETGSRLYVKGGIHAGNELYNIRAYANCVVTIGHGGAGTSGGSYVGDNRPQIGAVVNGGGAGILVTNDSNGHIDYCDINGVTGSGGGVQVVNQSRVHLVSCQFGNSTANYYNVRCDTSSTFIETDSSFAAATAKSVVQFGFSLDADANQKVYYDRLTGYFRFGLTTNLTPGCNWHFQVSEADSGISYSSAVLMSLEKDGDAYYGFGSSATDSAGLMFARNGVNRAGQFGYYHSNDTFGMRVNNTDTLLFHSTYVRPETALDNTVSLGSSAASRFKDVFATTLYPGAGAAKWTNGSGTPEGTLTAAIGSLYTDTATGRLYTKESGSGNTGWVLQGVSAPLPLTIASGSITIPATHTTVPVLTVLLTGEGGAADSLTAISGGSDGQLIVLRAADSAVDITIDNAVNLYVPTDFTLDHTMDSITLFRASSGVWGEQARGANYT